MTQFDQAFQAAAALGVTVVLRGRRQRLGGRRRRRQAARRLPGVEPVRARLRRHPLDAPPATRSRAKWSGTRMRLAARPAAASAASSRLPGYQKSAPGAADRGSTHKGRGVPDVAGDADPNSGYRVRVDGQRW